MKTESVVMSKSQLAMRCDQVGKSGEGRNWAWMPTLASCGRRYSATSCEVSGAPGRKSRRSAKRVPSALRG
ncbi:hypothetical protein D9M69_691230 [compost metagenome]